MAVGYSTRMILYGSDEALPEQRMLSIGHLSAILENGSLRYISIGGHEVIRGVYVALRDSNWGTVEPKFTDYELAQDDNRIFVKFTAYHKNEEVDFVWDGAIEVTRGGIIKFSMKGLANSNFYRGRIGFCVLHPMEVAGLPVEVVTNKGIVNGEFPLTISPHQPFKNILAIRHQTNGGVNVEVLFDGDLFEMEDHRNWTDASYKTYCTPLEIPFPVKVMRGDIVNQTVEIRVTPPQNFKVRHDAQNILVDVGAGTSGKMPPVGLVHSLLSKSMPDSKHEMDNLRALNLNHIRSVIELSDPKWKEVAEEATVVARELNLEMEIEVISGDEGEGLEQLVRWLRTVQPVVTRMLVFARSKPITIEKVISRTKNLLKEADMRLKVGGGSRAFFTEFNRASLPLEYMDFAGYPMNPQVHAFDNESLIETLPTQAITVDSARIIAGQLPLCVGPITFKMRFNPNATNDDPSNFIPGTDPRQKSLFGAGWTLGSLCNLASCGASWLTYFETIGARGVMDHGGWSLFPMYHIFAYVGEFSYADVKPVKISDPLKTAALALKKGSLLRVIVANLTNDSQSIKVKVPGCYNAKLRVLNESSFEQAAIDRLGFRARVDRDVDMRSDTLELELSPFAITCADMA